jgi:glycosyltransferase involved in cell wall biosynthesis
VLFIGRLQARKRVDNLLRACAALPAGKQPRVLVVGDGPARQELIHLAESIYPQAEFPGTVSGVALEPYFSQADVFVLPGTGGLAVQQALGHGLPVIAAEGDGTQDDLVRPGNGWRVQPNDVPALQSAIAEALSDPGRLREMGRESYRIARQEANLESMVAGFLRAITTISELGLYRR